LVVYLVNPYSTGIVYMYTDEIDGYIFSLELIGLQELRDWEMACSFESLKVLFEQSIWSWKLILVNIGFISLVSIK